MTTKNMLGLAVSIAAVAHEGQLDKGGNAYILHPIRVMQRLRTSDEELMQIAILHDVVEDCKAWTFEALEAAGFSKRVTDALKLLTHVRGEEYSLYIHKIATNEDAILVKMEDLRDNSDVTRLKGLTPKDFQRMEKYQRSYQFLKNALENFKLQ